MKCTNCGFDAENNTVCPICGHQISPVQNQEPPVDPQIYRRILSLLSKIPTPHPPLRKTPTPRRRSSTKHLQAVTIIKINRLLSTILRRTFRRSLPQRLKRA